MSIQLRRPWAAERGKARQGWPPDAIRTRFSGWPVSYNRRIQRPPENWTGAKPQSSCRFEDDLARFRLPVLPAERPPPACRRLRLQRVAPANRPRVGPPVGPARRLPAIHSRLQELGLGARAADQLLK